MRLLALSLVLATPVLASAPPAKTQAGYWRFNVGSFEVTAISDGTFDLPATKLIQGVPPAQVSAQLQRSFQPPDKSKTSDTAYLVNTGSKLVLVDTGAGNLFAATLGKFAQDLKATGYSPEQIDEVVITHLHGDHIGGLVKDGAPAFPNATLHIDQADVDYWLSEEKMKAAPKEMQGFFQGAMNMVKPWQQAGKLKTFTAETEIVPGVRAMPTHGHTPGHTSYVVESGGQKLYVAGDLIHIPAVQWANPTATVAFDADANAARAQRLKVFGAAAKEGALVAATHLPFPGVGHLRTAGKGFEWVPLVYVNE